MDTIGLLDKLAELGIAAVLEDGKLYLQPGDRVTPELMAEARAHKAELVGALSHRRVPPDTGLQPLLARLRSGQAWLAANLDRHMATEPVGDPVFVASLEAWVALEALLRRLYGFDKCIHTDGQCPDDAPAWCSACGARDRQEST